MRNRMVDLPEALRKVVKDCPHCEEAIVEFVTFLFTIRVNLDQTLQGAQYEPVSQSYRAWPFQRLRMYRIRDERCCISFVWKRGIVADIRALC